MTALTWTAGPTLRESARVEVNCHRRRGGPYTGLGAILRVLVPQVLRQRPRGADAWAIEILSVAPDLEGLMDAAPATLASLAVGGERTRIYPPLRSRRLAHGLVDFLHECAELLAPFTLSFTHVDAADPTDQEFIALLLRRKRSDRIRVVIQAGMANLPEDLAVALVKHAHEGGPRPNALAAAQRSADQMSQACIDSDGTSADPAELAAYHATSASRRKALHDARAASLEREGDWSARLGAIPYHLERGSAAALAEPALRAALEHCMARGFYHAAIDYGLRLRSLLDPDQDADRYWYVTSKTAVSLAILGRPDEAVDLYLELRGRYSLPVVHMNTSYALGMVHTRYLPPDRKDHRVALGWVNNAVAIASLLEDPEERAFNTVFNRNGLALIEMHLGHLEMAFALVNDGLERLRRELPADRHRLHKSVLLYNRASLHARMGRPEQALADYTAVIAEDPNWQDYYFERADLRRRLGDPVGALADYDHAESITPPFWELHYNRADLRAELGDLSGAIADLARVVELEPAELVPWHNLVALLQEAEQHGRARRYVADGLGHHPGDPGLLCARGQLALEAGDPDAAGRDFELALAADQDFVPALAGRATLAFDAGDCALAIGDLTRALAANGPDPALLYNRAQAYQAAGQPEAAAADLDAARELGGQTEAGVR